MFEPFVLSLSKLNNPFDRLKANGILNFIRPYLQSVKQNDFLPNSKAQAILGLVNSGNNQIAQQLLI
jgi:hypothetical protein